MKEYKEKNNSFLLGLCITLGTIVIGLTSYIVFTSDLPGREMARCEYYGWAYAHKETFDSVDGCNICSCNDGFIVCTSMACDEEPNDDLN
jgi:hypothetical protein